VSAPPFAGPLTALAAGGILHRSRAARLPPAGGAAMPSTLPSGR